VCRCRERTTGVREVVSTTNCGGGGGGAAVGLIVVEVVVVVVVVVVVAVAAAAPEEAEAAGEEAETEVEAEAEAGDTPAIIDTSDSRAGGSAECGEPVVAVALGGGAVGCSRALMSAAFCK
jgi:hypothetical protein